MLKQPFHPCLRRSFLTTLATCSPRPSPTLNLLSHRRRANYSTQPPLPQTSFPDPTRPDLYYHFFQRADSPRAFKSPSATFALSFNSTPPPRANSSTIIGWLPAEGEVESSLHDFKENGEFRPILHSAIQAALAEGIDDMQINAALQLENGWMHIHDERNLPAASRIGDPDDIIASVLVQDSKILAETYQPMPTYRLCTTDGVVTLTPGLTQKLHQMLVERAKIESQT